MVDKWELALLVTCCHCNGLYQDPRILPACGHSLCLGCANDCSISQQHIECPDCRTLSMFYTANGAQDLPRNVQLERTVEFYSLAADDIQSPTRSQSTLPELSSSSTGTHACPHYQPKPYAFPCSHCQVFLCSECEIGHKERIRLETIGFAQSLKNQVLTSYLDQPESEGLWQQLRNNIEEMIGRCKARATDDCDRLKKYTLSDLSRKRTQMLKIAEDLSKPQFAFVLADRLRQCPEMPLSEVAEADDDICIIAEQIEHYVAGNMLPVPESDDYLDYLIQHKLCSNIKWRQEKDRTRTYVHEQLLEDCVMALRQAVFSKSCYQMNAIFLKCQHNPEIMQAVTDHREWPAEEDRGSTILHLAALDGHTNQVRFLIAKFQADVYARTDAVGNTVAHVAAEAGHLHLIRYLYELEPNLFGIGNNFGDLPIFLAAAKNHVHVVRFLIEVAGAENVGTVLDMQNSCGRTVLHYAAMSDASFVATYLLRKGADLFLFDSFGKQPIHLACCHGALNCVQAMVSHDPTVVYERETTGLTPLEEARNAQQNDIIAFLEAEIQCQEMSALS